MGMDSSVVSESSSEVLLAVVASRSSELQLFERELDDSSDEEEWESLSLGDGNSSTSSWRWM